MIQSMYAGRVYAELRSEQGFAIELSYVPYRQVINDIPYHKASGFTIAVQGRTSIRKPICRFVLVNQHEDGRDVHHALINAVGGDPADNVYFSGSIFGLITMARESFPMVLYRPQVALWMNGVWQTDPIQCDPDIPSWEPHNFNFAWRWWV